jgi:hypothetical protein
MSNVKMMLESRTRAMRGIVGGWRLLLACAVFLSVPARAQSPDTELSPVFVDVDAPIQDDTDSTPAAQVATAENSADAVWRSAALALAEGDASTARDLWREFAERYPADRRAQSAARLAEVITSVELSPTRETDITSQSGRVQLAIFGALYGASVGLLVGLEASENSNSGDLPIWLTVAGAGTGLGLTLGVTKGDYVRSSQPAMISSGAIWGYGIGLAIVGSGPMFETCSSEDYDPEYEYCEISPTAFRMIPLALGATAVGVTSYLANRYPDIPSGDIALVNAGGLWGTSTGILAALFFDVDSEYSPVNMLLPGTLLGLTAGGLLAPRLEVSRTRMQLINVSGVLGLGLAGAIGASSDVHDATGWGLLLLGGQTAGLTTGALLTRNRRSSPRATNTLSSLRFAPTMLGDATGRQHRGLVLSGRW